MPHSHIRTHPLYLSNLHNLIRHIGRQAGEIAGLGGPIQIGLAAHMTAVVDATLPHPDAPPVPVQSPQPHTSHRASGGRNSVAGCTDSDRACGSHDSGCRCHTPTSGRTPCTCPISTTSYVT